jgi:hypothetical protein
MLKHLTSCSVLALGSEPDFTTYKYRESSGMQKRVIDYVFVRDGQHKVVGC